MVCRNRHWKTPEQSINSNSPNGPRLTNPLPTLRVILTDPESLMILLIIGQSYCGIYSLMTSIPSLMHATYGYNSEQIGYLFLAWSAGTIISAFSTGAYLDWQYRLEARKMNLDPDTDLKEIPEFPIEKLRLQFAIPILIVTGTTIVCPPLPFFHPPILATNRTDNLRLAPRIQIPHRLRLHLRNNIRLLVLLSLPDGHDPNNGHPPLLPRRSRRNSKPNPMSPRRRHNGMHAPVHT